MKRERASKKELIERKMQRFFEKNMQERKIVASVKIGNMYFFTKEKKHLNGVQCCCNYLQFDFVKAKQMTRYCSFLFALISTNKKIPKEFKEKLKRCGIGFSIFDVETNKFTEIFKAILNPEINEMLKNKKLSKILK